MAGKEKPTDPKTPAPEGDRIAKVLSRRGIASRREAERLVEAGEVTVNGKVITSPALNVTDRDRITVSGQLLPDEEPARLWLYYKPEGLVTSASDEKGRETVFDRLPEDLPRVMSVGRLDLNSEGLLLLTNDGELKRRLELPSTGWLRKYRVRVNGNPTDPDLEPLRKGITIEGERFQPMQVVLDRIQGANAWLTVGLREGKNREIRRAMSAINLTVNRLIRVSYGPFRLGEMQPGQVEEVRQKVLREQLGEITASAAPADGKAPRRGPRDAPRDAPAEASAKARTRAPRKSATGRLPEGEGLRQLSDAWGEATRPRGGPAAAKPARGAKPAGARPTTVRHSSASGTEGAARTTPRSRSSDDAPARSAKPATSRTRAGDDAAPAPRSAAKPALRRSAAPADAPAKPARSASAPRGAPPAGKAPSGKPPSGRPHSAKPSGKPPARGPSGPKKPPRRGE